MALLNKHPVTCYSCDRRVDKACGFLTRRLGSWSVKCFVCHYGRKSWKVPAVYKEAHADQCRWLGRNEINTPPKNFVAGVGVVTNTEEEQKPLTK